MRFKFPRQLVVAHRGASGLVEHENTIEAFQKAIDVGADCIEIDIRKTKDKEIVVYHDADINGVHINTLTHKELIELVGFDVPTLEEAITFVKGKILIDVELKEAGYEKEVIEIIKRHLSNEEFYIRSFIDNSLRKVKNIDKGIITALLVGVGSSKCLFFTRLKELFPCLRIFRTRCDIISPHYRLLRFGFMWRMRLIGRPVSVWTVDDESLMDRLLHKTKVHSIVTNYPDRALKVLGRTNEQGKEI